jgi:hypothetical protein
MSDNGARFSLNSRWFYNDKGYSMSKHILTASIKWEQSDFWHLKGDLRNTRAKCVGWEVEAIMDRGGNITAIRRNNFPPFSPIQFIICDRGVYDRSIIWRPIANVPPLEGCLCLLVFGLPIACSSFPVNAPSSFQRINRASRASEKTSPAPGMADKSARATVVDPGTSTQENTEPRRVRSRLTDYIITTEINWILHCKCILTTWFPYLRWLIRTWKEFISIRRSIMIDGWDSSNRFSPGNAMKAGYNEAREPENLRRHA